MSQLTCPKCGSEDLEAYELTGHADGSVTCPYCPEEPAGPTSMADAATWTPDLSGVEAAVVDVLTGESGCSWHHGCDVEDCYGPRARAIVAKARPLIAKELVESAEIIREFAQSRPITSAEAKAIFDGIAALSRPTSEEH